ncbi:hypothetical protein HMPREF9120_02758 [Neisseria sp. oral taxon 020 str. F0370]|nr:hypothetical protein HMPREF9120_02758 [Neisseria sp. oral taxon 020 str. F0370]
MAVSYVQTAFTPFRPSENNPDAAEQACRLADKKPPATNAVAGGFLYIQTASVYRRRPSENTISTT